MAKQTIIEAAGLYTNPSELKRPDGALSIADNITITRDGIIEPRRGWRVYSPTAVEMLVRYGYQMAWVNYTAGTVGYASQTLSANTGTFTSKAAPLNNVNGLPQFAVAASNLYMPHDTLLRKWANFASEVELAGAPYALGYDYDDQLKTAAINAMSLTSNVVTVTTSSAHGFKVGQIITQTSATEAPYATGNYTVATVPSSTSFTYALVAANDAGNANPHTFAPAQLDNTNGWLEIDKQVAYRVVINFPDANQTECPGAPSMRFVISNTSAFRGWKSATKANPILYIQLATAIGHRADNWEKATVRIYRSKQVDLSIEPPDEMGLIAERQIKTTEVAASLFQITDITPDELRGEALYTNPSQEGILQSNDMPPGANLLCYDGSRLLIAGDTQRFHEYIFNILAVGGTNGIQNGDVVLKCTATTSTPTNSLQFKLETSGTDAQNIRKTAQNFVAAFNRDQADAYAFYISGANEAPGKILIRSLTQYAAFGYGGITSGKRDAFYPSFSPTQTNFSLQRVSNVVTATTLSGSHNYTVGESIILESPNANFTAGPHTITAVTSTTFTYASTGSNASLTTGLRLASLQALPANTNRNRIYESKAFEPDAVPALNYADVGENNKLVYALAATRNQVFAFKEDGLFIRTAPLTWELFDPTVKLTSYRSVKTLLNNVYAWTSQGVVAVNDTGVEIVSRPIEKTLNDLIALNTNVTELAFAITHEGDRTYSLYVQSAAGDQFPKQALVFNTITRTWTREEIKTASGTAEVLSGETLLDEYQREHKGLVTATQILLERRNFNKSDYHDLPGTAYTVSTINANFVTFTSTPNFTTGDAVVSNAGNVYLVTQVAGPYFYMSPSIALTETTFAKCTAIPSIVQYAPLLASGPENLKLWRSLVALFQNCHAKSMTAGFSTELKQTEETLTVNLETLAGQWGATWDKVERPYNLSLVIPQEMRRAQRVNLKLTFNTALQVFALTGIVVGLEVSGDKVSK